MDKILALLNNTALISVLSAIGGALFWNFVEVYRSRVKTLSYTVTHERLGLSADDAIFGNVSVTWQGNPVQNLFVSTVRIENTTSADYSNLKFKVFTGNETLLLTERASIGDSTYFPRLTEGWRNSIAVPEGNQPTEAQWHTYLHTREYDVAVLNRNQVVELTFLTTVPNAPQQPAVWVDLLHEGARLQFRLIEQQILGVPVKFALRLGWLACLIIVVTVSVLTSRVWVAATVCLLSGLSVQAIGAAIYRIFRSVRHIIFR